MAQITNVTKIVWAMNNVAAGTTNQTGSTIDTAGFDGCRFIALLGTLSPNQVTSLKVQGGAAANGSDATDLTGAATAAAADADSNKTLIVDVYRPKQRYLTPIVLRATGNAVIDGVIAELYQGKNYPEAADTTVSAQKLIVSP